MKEIKLHTTRPDYNSGSSITALHEAHHAVRNETLHCISMLSKHKSDINWNATRQAHKHSQDMDFLWEPFESHEASSSLLLVRILRRKAKPRKLCSGKFSRCLCLTWGWRVVEVLQDEDCRRTFNILCGKVLMGTCVPIVKSFVYFFIHFTSWQ